MKAPGAKHHTWQCQRCGHRLIDHSARRDMTPSALRLYLNPGACNVDGCRCPESVTAFLK